MAQCILTAMDPEKLSELHSLLMSRQEGVFRISFFDGEAYDLSQFYAFEDGACVATVIDLVNIPEEKRNFFEQGSAMQFNLNEILEVRDRRTDEVIFLL